ncbi:hypothetical protein K443DRAFT_643215 [Laccaria amethystina LaAM-08-1]|uniref:Phosphatidate phosphatase APP1 catalytic domain-containing protein n=1 Tax=Laccaria amethystina LaAM-08-1 TaxID=1095629 RepID=A0A0C9WRF4_9AGAR|nr:hypothetical protein K443DRAFT_643215 [Laccaria amethystina LaAM-08-1]
MCQHHQASHIAFGEPVVEHNFKVIAQLMPPPLTLSPQVLPIVQPSPVSYMIKTPITRCPIRVISDIDDTVKSSDIVSGARVVIQNVFVRELQDNVIPCMGEWYRSSVRLRSYAGRSLFSGLISAPASRKRAGLVGILDSSPESKFFLIGDSGEKTWSSMLIFIIDVDSGEPINDPTGSTVMDAAGARPSSAPLVPRSDSTATSPVNPVDRGSQETIFSSEFNLFELHDFFPEELFFTHISAQHRSAQSLSLSLTEVHDLYVWWNRWAHQNCIGRCSLPTPLRSGPLRKTARWLESGRGVP